MTKFRPVVRPSAYRAGTGKTATISGMTRDQITEALGVEPIYSYEKGWQEKTRWEWRFTIDGLYCAIWDYKAPEGIVNTTWSACGSKTLLASVLGQEHVE